MSWKRLLGFAAACLFATGASAGGSGSALVNHWKKNDVNGTNIFVTNISDSTVTFYIDLYDQSGTLYDENSEAGDNINVAGFSGDPTTGGGTLQAKQTGNIVLTNGIGSDRYGSAVIRWESQDDIRIAATGFGYRFYIPSGGRGLVGIDINGGAPF